MSLNWVDATVRSLWRAYSAPNEPDREPKGRDKDLFDSVLSELTDSHGFKTSTHWDDYHISQCLRSSLPHGLDHETSDVLFYMVKESTKNIFRHAQVTSKNGDSLGYVGRGIFLVRYLSEKSSIEMYFLDKGPGFVYDREGIPRIQDAIVEGNSLGLNGREGVGLTHTLRFADDWEIESIGYRMRKDSTLEQTEGFTQGSLLSLVKQC